MSEQSHEEEEELTERLYNKLVAKFRDDEKLDIIGHVNEKSRRKHQIDDANNTTSWFCIGSGAIARNVPSDDDDPSIFQLQQDLYAILATASWRSLPFWISFLVIFGFQYLLVIMLLANKADIYSDSNPLNLPSNVEPSVRVGQVLLIVIALFHQRDLLDGITSFVRDIPDHFCGKSHFVGMTRLQWRLSAIVQLIQGLLNFLVSFVLVAQSETVPDVILKVLGVAFISDLDELAFELATEGYLGGPMKRMSNDVCDVRFHRRTTISLRKSMPIAAQKVKKDAHIISAFAVFLMALGVFGYFAIRQNNGRYLEQDIRIEFGDEVVPFLGLFNGCYRKSESNKHMSGRLVYEQVGYPNGGKFGFCSAFGKGDGGWTFFIGDMREDEVCESYILRSGGTSTFSLLEAGKTKWYTSDDLPMDYFEITVNKAPTTECGQSKFDSSKEASPSILAFDEMSMTKLSLSMDVDARSERSLDAAFSHPIYYSNNNENGSFTLIFFTGRRWIRTLSDHIKGLGNETSVPHIGDFFYSKNGLFEFIDQLRASEDEEVELVSAVSEIVDTARDQGSPIGLLWYLPRYEEKVNSVTDETETDRLQRNFPSANLARPIDSVWTCLVCSDETNPCFNEGICNTDKGTCDCKHGETGALCQEPPTGNGICNLYFNTAEYNYDGGDCCAGTCRGVDCGKDDLPDPFLGLAQAYVDEYGWYYPFQNMTEEWKVTFRGREFAFGVDIVTNENLKMQISEPPLRFNHCIDPNTTLLTFEIDGHTIFAETTLRCGGSPYLQTPRFQIESTKNRPNYSFKEEVRVPYGVQCEFKIGAFGEISIFSENSSVPFLQQEGDPFDFEPPISLHIPKSECVWDLFRAYLIPPVFTDSEYQEFTGGVDLDSMCNRDPGEVLDRYLVWKIIKSVSDGGGTSPNFDGHICDKMDWGGIMLLSCGDDGLRLSEVLHIAGDELPSELWSLTQLTTLWLFENDLYSLPTEIGRLTALAEVDLRVNQLPSLPSEVGRLTSLTKLRLQDNQLRSLPTEMGRLTSLTKLGLGDNRLRLLPTEIGNLTSLVELELWNNALSSIPSEIATLTLKRLDLSNNTLTSIPSEIGNLARLEELYLGENKLTWIPSEIGYLISLEDLHLTENKLEWIPSELGNLGSLRSLEIGENKLASIPSEIGNLTALRTLFLLKNQLTSLPPEIGDLSALVWLCLNYNPMTWDSLPVEVQRLELEGTDIDVCDFRFGKDGCIKS